MRITMGETQRRAMSGVVVVVLLLLMLFLGSCNSAKGDKKMVVLMEPVLAGQDEEVMISGQVLFEKCFAAPDESTGADVLREVVLT